MTTNERRSPAHGSVTRREYRRVVRRALIVVVAVVAVSCGASTAAPGKVVHVTFVGDSVSASINYTPIAQRQFRHGLRVTLDLRVCRRLIAPSCTYQDSTPTTALQAVQGYGRSLGDVLIVKVGYNESSEGYRQGIDRVMRAALAQGAKGVVWVTLRETHSIYRSTNMAIRTAAKRWPQLVVADWNAYSSGRSWFGTDGLHLTVNGANKLAEFVRQYALQAAS